MLNLVAILYEFCNWLLDGSKVLLLVSYWLIEALVIEPFSKHPYNPRIFLLNLCIRKVIKGFNYSFRIRYVLIEVSPELIQGFEIRCKLSWLPLELHLLNQLFGFVHVDFENLFDLMFSPWSYIWQLFDEPFQSLEYFVFYLDIVWVVNDYPVVIDVLTILVVVVRVIYKSIIICILFVPVLLFLIGSGVIEEVGVLLFFFNLLA